MEVMIWFLSRTLPNLRRVIKIKPQGIRSGLGSCPGQNISLFCSSSRNNPGQSFAAAMAEALAQLEQDKQAQQMEREKSEEHVKAIKEKKRKLKRRKWVEWQYQEDKEEGATSAGKEKVPRITNGVGEGAVEGEAEVAKGDRIKRRKFAMLLGYCGASYFGMQRNPGMNTIEEELFKAMLKHGWITEESFEASQVICFQRAARTDKGVSAARQVCSIKLPENLDVKALNQDLPDDIRLFGLERVTKSFNSKDRCDARTYTYTMPTIAFSSEDIVDTDATSTTSSSSSIPKNYETFRLSSEKWTMVEKLLKKFEGTKNFHNFTSRKNYFDPSAKRFIMSFTCSPSFLSPQGMEFITLRVKGQSFMLHQIRKMVGVVLAIARGLCDDSLLERAFGEEKINLPKAPGLGLVLDTVHYDRYNLRFGSDGIHQMLTWSDYEAEISQFIEQRIYSSIYDIEYHERPMVAWLLEHLARHNFEGSQEQDNETSTQPTALASTTSSSFSSSTNTVKASQVSVKKGEEESPMAELSGQVETL